MIAALLAALAGSWGYIEFRGPAHIVAQAPVEARQDPFSGTEGAALEERIRELEASSARIDERLKVQESREIPPKWLLQRIGEIDKKLDALISAISGLEHRPPQPWAPVR